MRLFIDGDILAYKVSFSAEQQTNWGDGVWTWHADAAMAIAKAEDWIGNLLKETGASVTDCTFCFTGSVNWRHGVMPEYKAHRKDSRKPLVLKPVIDHIMASYVCEREEPLEADDLMGIYATTYGQDALVVSIDKDLRQIPGKHKRDVGSPVHIVSPLDGLRWHMLQTLTGDKADGYDGCPGIGPVKANKILANLTDPKQMWDGVVEAYKKAGLGAEEALRQARVAYILQSKAPEKRLWEPPAQF